MDPSRARDYFQSSAGLRIARVVFVVVCLVSGFMLFSPASQVPTEVPLSDKVVHALIFFSLAVTAAASRLAPIWVSSLALVFYAGASEVLQGLLPIGRDGDVVDFAADLVGLFLALAVIALAMSFTRARPASADKAQG